MTFGVTTKDMTATTRVKCCVRMWNMWNHNTMQWKGYPGKKIHSTFRSTDSKCYKRWKQWDQSFTFFPISKKKKKKASKYKIFGLWNTWVETNVFPENCKSGDSPGKGNNLAHKDDKITKTIFIYILITYSSSVKALHLHCFVEHGMLLSQPQFIKLISSFSPKGLFLGMMVRNSPVLHSRHDQSESVGASASGWGSSASTSVPSPSTSPLSYIGNRWSRRRKHMCVSKFICWIDFSQRNISHFYPLVNHNKYSADSMTSIMTADVIINTEVNIDEVLELENQQQDFAGSVPSVFYKPPNHIALLMPDHKQEHVGDV